MIYVIGGMKITYKGADEKVRQTLTLYRREWPGRLNNMG